MGRLWNTGRTLIAIGALGILTLSCDRGSDASGASAVAEPASAVVDPPAPAETPAETVAAKPPATKPVAPKAAAKTPVEAPAETAAQKTAAKTPSKKKTPAKTAETQAAKAPPTTIRFDKKEHDFGQMSDTDTGNCTFPFVNTGSETLIIAEVKTSCGCTAASLPKKEYAPGEGDEIKVTFDPKGQGKQAKTITVISNAESSPGRLTIRADVVPFVSVEPRYLRLGDLPIGEAHLSTLTISSTDPDMTIESVTASGRYLKAELVGERPGVGSASLYEVAVTIEPEAPWGGFNGSVAIKCKGRPSPDKEPIEHTARVSVVASMFGDIKSDQTMFRLSVIKPGASFEKSIKLTSASGEPFAVLSAELTRSSMPGVVVTSRALDGGGHELVLTGDTKEYLGSVNGEVKVTTDVAGEENLTFRFGGIVRER